MWFQVHLLLVTDCQQEMELNLAKQVFVLNVAAGKIACFKPLDLLLSFFTFSSVLF